MEIFWHQERKLGLFFSSYDKNHHVNHYLPLKWDIYPEETGYDLERGGTHLLSPSLIPYVVLLDGKQRKTLGGCVLRPILAVFVLFLFVSL